MIGEPGKAAQNVWGIKPTVGEHTVRIAIQLVDGRDLADGPPGISVVSNPVKIQIVPNTPPVDAEPGERKISVRSEVELSQPLGIAAWRTKAAIRNIRVRSLPE